MNKTMFFGQPGCREAECLWSGPLETLPNCRLPGRWFIFPSSRNCPKVTVSPPPRHSARTDQSAFLALFNSLLDELQAEVEAEAASAPTDVGEPFPTIRPGIFVLFWYLYSTTGWEFRRSFPLFSGPNSTSSRIAVVGAGPSGINMAYKLKKNGYNNVVVYEKSNRVGGKSDDVFYRYLRL